MLIVFNHLKGLMMRKDLHPKICCCCCCADVVTDISWSFWKKNFGRERM